MQIVSLPQLAWYGAQVLEERHGDTAKVAIYSSAEIQYCG
jgi:hypothetical protein